MSAGKTIELSTWHGKTILHTTPHIKFTGPTQKGYNVGSGQLRTQDEKTLFQSGSRTLCYHVGHRNLMLDIKCGGVAQSKRGMARPLEKENKASKLFTLSFNLFCVVYDGGGSCYTEWTRANPTRVAELVYCTVSTVEGYMEYGVYLIGGGCEDSDR